MARDGGIGELLQSIVLKSGSEKAKRVRSGKWGGGIVPHVEYQTRPIDWLVDKLGFKREDIVWSLRPQYAGHAWVATQDPLARALEALAENRWVGVESGSGTGKTYALGAGVTLWFLACWENARVFTLAPRERQLQDNLWKEITKLWPRFEQNFPTAELTTLTIRMRGGIDETWSAHGMGAKVGSDETVAGTARGYHEAHQLIIMEEGPGIDEAIWNTMQATSGGGHNLVLGMGNPDSVHDPLHRFCIKSRVTDVRISCYDHPNVVCNDPWMIPGAATRQWISDRAEDWGEASNMFARFVHGVAPKQSEDSLFLTAWLEAAAARQGDKDLRDGPLALGVDVADSPTGDKSAISRWVGACCTEVQEFSAEDASAVGRRVFREIKDPFSPIDPKRVGIDSVGVGTSCINELKRLGVRVKHISGGMRPGPFVDIEAMPAEADPDESDGARKKRKRNVVVELADFDNFRSQVYWRAREDLRLFRIAIPNDPELFRELTAHTWRVNEKTGKKEVRTKDEVKAKLRKSPNKADAFVYGNWVRWRRIVKADNDQQPDRGRAFKDQRLERLIAQQDRAQATRRREARSLLRRNGLK